MPHPSLLPPFQEPPFLVLTQAHIDTPPAPDAGRGYSHSLPCFLVPVLLYKWSLSSCSSLSIVSFSVFCPRKATGVDHGEVRGRQGWDLVVSPCQMGAAMSRVLC